MAPDIESLVHRLEEIAEELADLALDTLRSGVEGGSENAVAEERRLTRARRAVEKAGHLLRTDYSSF